MKTIKSGVIYNIIYQLLLILVPLITSPYLSRVIGAEGIGEYQFRYSVAYYFFLFAMLGVNTYGNREIAKCRESKKKRSLIFWQIFYIQLFLGVCLSVGYVFLGQVILKDVNSIYYVQILQILSACVDINWYAFALEEFRLTTLRSIVIKVMATVSILLFVNTADDLLIYAIIILGSNIVGLCMIVPLVFKTTTFQKPDFMQIRKHLKPNLLLFLPSIASSVYIYMDKVMIGFLGNSTEVGFYNYAENIVSIPNAVTNALSTVMLPRISNMIIHGKYKKSRKYLRLVLCIVSIINIAFMFGMIAIADIFVPWYLGEEYLYTAYLIKVRAPLIVLNGISVILKTQWLLPLGRDKEFCYSILFGAALNVVLNMSMISKAGAVGASIATVVTFFFICAVQIYFSRDAVVVSEILQVLLLFGIIGYGMFMVINKVNDVYFSNIQIFVKLVLDVVVGGCMYLMTGVICIGIVKKIRDIKADLGVNK